MFAFHTRGRDVHVPSPAAARKTKHVLHMRLDGSLSMIGVILQWRWNVCVDVFSASRFDGDFGVILNKYS